MRERPGELRQDRAGSGDNPATVPTAPEPAEALAALVAKLRSELTGVRTAMRNRAVIEQAKGVLVERLGVSPDEGFDQLVRLSQRANIKLIEVAAAIVGTTAPDPQGLPAIEPTDEELRAHIDRSRRRDRPAERPAGRRARAGQPVAGSTVARRPAHEAMQAQHQLITSQIAAATSYDEIAEVIGAASATWPAPSTVVITLLDPAGAHRFVGAFGMNAADRSEWSRVPPHVDLPITRVTVNRTALLLTNRPALIESFPAMPVERYPTCAVFAAPLLDGDRVVGSLGLSWHEPIDLDDDTRRYLAALAAPVARRVAELASRVPATEARPLADLGEETDLSVWLPIVLETVADPAAVLAPVWADGRVVDFRIEYANEPAAALVAPARLDSSSTLLATYPRIGSEVLLARFADLLHSGGPVRLGPVRLTEHRVSGQRAPGSSRRPAAPADSKVMTVQATRLSDRVLMVWREHGEAELIYPQLLDAERIARIGSFCWELDAPEPRCSPQLYRMYYGDDQLDGPPPPIAIGDLTRCVHDEDAPALEAAVRRMLTGGEQLTREFRGAGRLAGRRLRIVARPEPARDGAVATVRGTIQDITDERAMESRLRRAEEALAAQRHRVDAELRAAQALQRALLPTEPELGTTDGLWVNGRCRKSDESGRVDGDWYDAFALPDRATLLVVGDVAGSGLAAMTAAARLRYAVRAYAALDLSPGQIVAAVNAMLCSLEPERTATLVVARYEAGRRLLRWAAASQAAPVRYQKNGGAELLPGPLGLPVGAASQVEYLDAEVELAPGDRLLLYTDSLVGGRGSEVVDVLDVLLNAGHHAERDDVEALVTHVVGSMYAAPGADMGAMLVRVNS
jgi:Stage II sporulation protein E (SpoIIE)/ANTAR domain